MMQVPDICEPRITSYKDPTDTRESSEEIDHHDYRDSITIYFKHSKTKVKNRLSSDKNSISHVKSNNCEEKIDKRQTEIQEERESGEGMKTKLREMDDLLQQMEEERKYLKMQIQKLKDEHTGLHQNITNLCALHNELQKKSVEKMTSENRQSSQTEHKASDMDEIAKRKAIRAAKKRFYVAEWHKNRQANREQEIRRKKGMLPRFESKGPRCPICGQRGVVKLEECSNFDVHGTDFNYTKKFLQQK